MVKPKITIIVPVYKVEKYLAKCVDSLIDQTYENIEILLVDDGSPDKCPEICDEYAQKDLRIKVIHKENGGLSDARNEGILHAQGEYILFVDSDDYIDMNSCEKFVQIIKDNEPDIVVGNAYRVDGERIYPMKHTLNTNGKIISGDEYLKEELRAQTMHMAAWLNLYKKSFLEKNDLKFKKNLLHEDEEFTPRTFLKAKSVVGTNIFFYNYLIRENSITTSKNKLKNAEHLMQTCKELEKQFQYIQDIELKRLLNNHLVNKFLSTFQLAKLYKKEHQNLVDKDFLKGKACTNKNKIRVALFLLNKKVYYYINYISKGVK